MARSGDVGCDDRYEERLVLSLSSKQSVMKIEEG